jgi:hypothetical protein
MAFGKASIIPRELMNALTNTVLGLAFLVGMAATFMMYYRWGFPFDQENSRPPF